MLDAADVHQEGAKVPIPGIALDCFEQFFRSDPLDDEDVDFEGRPGIAFPFKAAEERLDHFDHDMAYAFYLDVSVILIF